MTARVSGTAVFLPAADAVASRVGSEMVLLHLGNSNYYGLDHIGTRVWELLKGGSTLVGICEALHQEFGVAEDVLANDVGVFLKDLLAHDLIREQSE